MIRARHVGRDVVAGLRNIVGGEVEDSTVMLAQAREKGSERYNRRDAGDHDGNVWSCRDSSLPNGSKSDVDQSP
jgi:hypothetical protein